MYELVAALESSLAVKADVKPKVEAIKHSISLSSSGSSDEGEVGSENARMQLPRMERILGSI